MKEGGAEKKDKKGGVDRQGCCALCLRAYLNGQLEKQQSSLDKKNNNCSNSVPGM